MENLACTIWYHLSLFRREGNMYFEFLDRLYIQNILDGIPNYD